MAPAEVREHVSAEVRRLDWAEVEVLASQQCGEWAEVEAPVLAAAGGRQCPSAEVRHLALAPDGALAAAADRE